MHHPASKSPLFNTFKTCVPLTGHLKEVPQIGDMLGVLKRLLFGLSLILRPHHVDILVLTNDFTLVLSQEVVKEQGHLDQVLSWEDDEEGGLFSVRLRDLEMTWWRKYLGLSVFGRQHAPLRRRVVIFIRYRNQALLGHVWWLIDNSTNLVALPMMRHSSVSLLLGHWHYKKPQYSGMTARDGERIIWYHLDMSKVGSLEVAPEMPPTPSGLFFQAALFSFYHFQFHPYHHDYVYCNRKTSDESLDICSTWGHSRRTPLVVVTLRIAYVRLMVFLVVFCGRCL